MANLFIRTYTFVDGTTAYGSQVEAEVGNIVNVLNNLNTAVSTWGQVSISNAVGVPFVADCASGSQDIADFKNNSVTKLAVASTGAITGQSTLTLTPVSNQIVLGTTRTITISAATPASSSRIVSIPDPGAAANFVLSEAAATINGVKTFATQLIAKGTSTNDSAAAGFIGELIETQQTVGVTAASTGTLKEVCNVSLTAGDWDVDANVVFEGQGGATSFTALGNFDVLIGTATAATTGSAQGYSRVKETQQATSISAYRTLVIPKIRVSLSGSASYYLNASCVYTSTAPVLYGTISARRVR